MLADDLERLVAFGAFRTGVPIVHVTIEVEHIDGVIRDALDEMAEASLSLELRGLDPLRLAMVFRDVGEADGNAVFVLDEIDDAVSPEAASVLPDAPAQGVEAAGFQGCAERLRRTARSLILGRKETGEMLSDSLVDTVALGSLRAGVPVRHDAVEVDHVDGVVP